MGLLRSL